jgi:hypothetical protein
MKNTVKARPAAAAPTLAAIVTHLGRLGLLAAVIFGAALSGCDNGTTPDPEPPDTVRDVQIAADTGYTIYVNCKPSQDDAKANIETAIRAIIADASLYATYLANQPEIRILVDDTLTSNTEARSKTSFAIKYSMALDPGVKGLIEGGIAKMDYWTP